MDLNIKIIEGVRQFPSLYDNQVNLDERNQAWLKLADKLKMHEIYLKIRWHSLVQGYQRDKNFKYAKHMEFVPRIIAKQAKTENWPEFVITEEDLKEERNTLQEQEEFVFLEIDDDENKATELMQDDKEKDNDCRETRKEMDEISKENFHNNEESRVESQKDCSKTEITNMTHLSQNAQLNTDKFDLSPPSGITSKVEEKMAAVYVNKNDDEFMKESKQVVVEKPPTLVTERCEDVIFGELVSAMLKSMDENKKKNIKKEIMNLLFS